MYIVYRYTYFSLCACECICSFEYIHFRGIECSSHFNDCRFRSPVRDSKVYVTGNRVDTTAPPWWSKQQIVEMWQTSNELDTFICMHACACACAWACINLYFLGFFSQYCLVRFHFTACVIHLHYNWQTLCFMAFTYMPFHIIPKYIPSIYLSISVYLSTRPSKMLYLCYVSINLHTNHLE